MKPCPPSVLKKALELLAAGWQQSSSPWAPPPTSHASLEGSCGHSSMWHTLQSAPWSQPGACCGPQSAVGYFFSPAHALGRALHADPQHGGAFLFHAAPGWRCACAPCSPLGASWAKTAETNICGFPQSVLWNWRVRDQVSHLCHFVNVHVVQYREANQNLQTAWSIWAPRLWGTDHPCGCRCDVCVHMCIVCKNNQWEEARKLSTWQVTFFAWLENLIKASVAHMDAGPTSFNS